MQKLSELYNVKTKLNQNLILFTTFWCFISIRHLMKGIEEIPKGRDANIYFSSLNHQNPTYSSSRSSGFGSNKHNNSSNKGLETAENMINNSQSTEPESGNGDSSSVRQSSNKRKRVNYNIQQIQAEQFLTAKPKSKSFSEELDNELIDLTNDSNLQSSISLVELRKANRRYDELNRENYNENIKIEIPKNITGLVIKRNTEPGPVVKRLMVSKKTWNNFTDELSKSELKLLSSNNNPFEVKPNAFKIEKLCTICGGVSYSSCIKCSARVCSIKCQNIHDETRCTHF